MSLPFGGDISLTLHLLSGLDGSKRGDKKLLFNDYKSSHLFSTSGDISSMLQISTGLSGCNGMQDRFLFNDYNTMLIIPVLLRHRCSPTSRRFDVASCCPSHCR